MKTLNLLATVTFIFVLAICASAQSAIKTINSTPAYQLLASHKSAVENDLKNLRNKYTEAYPGFFGKNFELALTELEIAKISALPKEKTSLLTETYGKLLVQKIQSEMQLRAFLQSHTLYHPGLTVITEKIRALDKELYDSLK